MSMAELQWVDTVVKLKSTIGSNSVPAVMAGGYWTIGDDGGGTFYWDASSSSGDNGVNSNQPGTIIVPTGSTSGRWVRLYSGPINVKWFGARGQGTDIDDAPAINKAISVAGDTRSSVFLPRGTYRLDAPLNMSAYVRLLGEGEGRTLLTKVGTSADTILFNSKSIQCEVSRLSISPRGDSKQTKQTSGAAIRFTEPITGGVALIKLSDLSFDFVRVVRDDHEEVFAPFQCIAVEGSGFAREIIISEVIIERIKMRYHQVGIKLCYALNWTLQNIILQPVSDSAPGSNILGVWIDTETEGCIFNNIFSLGGEHCWRIARSINTGAIDRGPSENRFYSCIGDNGTVSCLYISCLHRGIFTSCWYSVQIETSDAAVVMDSLEIWGVQWTNCQFVNIRGAGIQVNAATSFSIMNSTFSEWDLNGHGFSAVLIHPNRTTNFSIIGNQFIRDADFGSHVNNHTITVQPGQYNRYIISNNMSYSDQPDLGGDALLAVSDQGTAVRGKIVIPGHNL